MDFSLTPELRALREQVRAMVDDHVIPAEVALQREDAEGGDETLQRLRGLAREAGLWTPHLPPEHGGRGLGVMGMSVLFREMGRSLVGPAVFGRNADVGVGLAAGQGQGQQQRDDQWATHSCLFCFARVFRLRSPAGCALREPGCSGGHALGLVLLLALDGLLLLVELRCLVVAAARE